jgi:CHAD domain-containing protein
MVTHTTALDVLDERDKTVVRLALEDAALADGSVPRPMTGTLRVTPLRGYDREREAIVRFLEDELGLSPTEDLGLVRALRSVGRDPAREVPVWRVRLERGERAGRALRRVLLRLLEVMEANEEGLLADVDTEFLHDFRVAVRRTRSILGELKKVLPPAEGEHFRGEFAWLGKLTTDVRDLDVFLLLAHKRDDFQPLEEHLRAQRELARERMVEGLRTERYAVLRRDWRVFLESPRHGADPDRADDPIEAVSSRRIRKLHKGILSRAAVMDDDTRPTELHELRIECKKLRYMIDAFGCLYAEEHVEHLIRTLKRLQDVLGDYNDLSVQQAALYRFASEMPGASPTTLLALGGIVERLRLKAEQTRPRILERLREFASDEDAGRMKELLSSSSS